MRAVLVVALIGCSHPPPPAAPVARCPAVAPPPAPVAIGEDAVRMRSHAVIDAFDHGDVAALGDALGPGFVRFEGGKPLDRAHVLETVAKRKPGAPTIAKRTWSDETIAVHADDAIFIAKATEEQGGNTAHGGYRYVGFYTLHWLRDGNAWKLALWTWRPGGEQAERAWWNEVFRNSVGFNHEPNRRLVATVKGVRPGTALDVAMGQGRNALYLASQGWKVTGVDFSDEGIQAARAQAYERKLRIDAVNADVSTYDFGVARWDVVTMIYAGDDTAWIEKIKPSLKKGGLFVFENFAGDPDANVPDGFAPGQLAKLFAGYEILRDEVVEDVPDWAMDRAKLVQFVARKR